MTRNFEHLTRKWGTIGSLVMAAALASPSVQADTTWSFGGTPDCQSATNPFTGSGAENICTDTGDGTASEEVRYRALPGGTGPVVDISGWSDAGLGGNDTNVQKQLPNTGATTTEQKTGVTRYGGGLGLLNFNEVSSSGGVHSVDNTGGDSDGLLFDFSADPTNAWALTSFQLGYPGSGSESDFSVLYYVGNGTPEFDTSTDWAGQVGGGGSWALLGHFADVSGRPAKKATFNCFGDNDTCADGEQIFSSGWFVSAYNPAFGDTSNCDTVGVSGGVCVAGNDKGKIWDITGEVRPTDTPGVPEPGSLALLSLGFVSLAACRKIRSKA